VSENRSKLDESVSAVFRGKPLARTVYRLGELLVGMGLWGADLGDKLMRAARGMAGDR
jgi:hypothetical protein